MFPETCLSSLQVQRIAIGINGPDFVLSYGILHMTCAAGRLRTARIADELELLLDQLDEAGNLVCAAHLQYVIDKLRVDQGKALLALH